MKKIMVLALVLVVAQFASAAITWSVVDNTNGTFDITLTDTGAVIGTDITIVTSTGASFGVTNTAWNAGFDIAPDFNSNAYGSGNWGQATAAVTGVGTSVTGELLTFTVSGDEGDFVTISDAFAGAIPAAIKYFDGSNVSLDGTQIELVPEPMTMALLGLGGLFIRRRRA